MYVFCVADSCLMMVKYRDELYYDFKFNVNINVNVNEHFYQNQAPTVFFFAHKIFAPTQKKSNLCMPLAISHNSTGKLRAYFIAYEFSFTQ